MKNCYAQLFQTEDVMEAGHAVKANEEDTLLAELPVSISSPRRAWQQAAAVEGMKFINLHVHTRADLTKCNKVTISKHPTYSGDYAVADNGVNGDGTNWEILLGVRP